MFNSEITLKDDVTALHTDNTKNNNSIVIMFLVAAMLRLSFGCSTRGRPAGGTEHAASIGTQL